MQEKVLLVGKNLEDLAVMSVLLERLSYTPVVASTLEAATEMCASKPCRVVVLDFDSVVLDNKIIRNFKRRFPRVNVIISSEKKFHPELKEAITDHIYACVSKPVDPDELEYWLASIHRNETRSRDIPART